MHTVPSMCFSACALISAQGEEGEELKVEGRRFWFVIMEEQGDSEWRGVRVTYDLCQCVFE